MSSSVCTAVLISEFDITAGSLLKHVYPSNLYPNPDNNVLGTSSQLLAEAMLPEGSHLREQDWTVLVLNDCVRFEISQNSQQTLKSTENKEPLFLLNLVRTKMDRSALRGATCKALAIITNYRFYAIFKPLLTLALEQYLECNAEAQLAVLAQLYNSLNDISFNLPIYKPVEQRVYRGCRLRLLNTPPHALPSEKANVIWGSTQLTLRIPIGLERDEVCETSVSAVLQRFEKNYGFMEIFRAVLLGKRILFLGYQQPVVELCQLVISTCLICPLLTNVLQSRCFPYINLTHLGFLQIPGFIAGVTNPLFESRKEWWDLLCNLSTNEVVLNPNYREELLNSGSNEQFDKLNTSDALFASELQNGLKVGLGEEFARTMLYDYSFANLEPLIKCEYKNLSREEILNDIKDEWNSSRLKLFVNSPSYQNFRSNIDEQIESSSLDRTHLFMLLSTIRSLQSQNITSAQLILLLTELNFIKERGDILELLSLLPESQGCLSCLAFGLLNRNKKVRELTAEIMQKIDSCDEGKAAIQGLNYFLLIAWLRLSPKETVLPPQDLEINTPFIHSLVEDGDLIESDLEDDFIDIQSELTSDIGATPFASPQQINQGIRQQSAPVMRSPMSADFESLIPRRPQFINSDSELNQSYSSSSPPYGVFQSESINFMQPIRHSDSGTEILLLKKSNLNDEIPFVQLDENSISNKSEKSTDLNDEPRSISPLQGSTSIHRIKTNETEKKFSPLSKSTISPTKSSISKSTIEPIFHLQLHEQT